MKARTIQAAAAALILAIPFIMVWLIAKGHYSFDQAGGLSAIGLLFMMLGVVVYFTSNKLGTS